MRKLMMKMSISVDGFVCGARGEKDWVFKTGDEESAAHSAGLVSTPGLIIMGRKSFEEMAPYWPTASGPFAKPMNEIPKGVFTKKGFAGIPAGSKQSPAEASWTGAQIFNGDLKEDIRKLKTETGKPILALGGAGFMRSLIETDLIDEYHLFIHPVALGSGLSIFTDVKMPLYLKVKDVKTFTGGAMALTYHPA